VSVNKVARSVNVYGCGSKRDEELNRLKIAGKRSGALWKKVYKHSGMMVKLCLWTKW
jgi:hypothetical protein